MAKRDKKKLKVMIETLQYYSMTQDFNNLKELKDFLIANRVARVSFRISDLSGPSSTFNDKDVEDISQEDFDWLAEKSDYKTKTIVIESQWV